MPSLALGRGSAVKHAHLLSAPQWRPPRRAAAPPALAAQRAAHGSRAHGLHWPRPAVHTR
eukprot:363584-Chlamydomonas_euryale.AAC.3